MTYTLGDAIQSVQINTPITSLHQLWVDRLVPAAQAAPHDGIVMPRWLFEACQFMPGEKVVITREHSGQRCATAEQNRTATAVFAHDSDETLALGPTAAFLQSPGPSCLIAYGADQLDVTIRTLNANFSHDNQKNREEDLTLEYAENLKIVSNSQTEAPRVQYGQARDVLIGALSGLVVEYGEPYCNPVLAQVPLEVFERLELPVRAYEAYFSHYDKRLAAMKSYIVPSSDPRVCMSGALYSAFPPGSRFHVNLFARVNKVPDFSPNMVDVAGWGTGDV